MPLWSIHRSLQRRTARLRPVRSRRDKTRDSEPLTELERIRLRERTVKDLAATD